MWSRPIRCRIVACRSETWIGSSTALKPSSSVAPIAWPPFTPAPASHMLKPCQSWSRPGLPTPSLVGVRPNSPPQTSSVSSHRPVRFRSVIKRRDRLIGFAGVQLVVRDAVVVAVPGIFDVAAAGVELDEADALVRAAGA